MQGLILHAKRRAPLGKGTPVLPLERWQDSKLPLRILRGAERADAVSPSQFLTLCALPDSNPVQVVQGMPESSPADLVGHPLDQLPREEREILDDYFAFLSEQPSTLESSLKSVARLILCAPLPVTCIKWTKDLRLLEDDRRKTNTKRRR